MYCKLLDGEVKGLNCPGEWNIWKILFSQITKKSLVLRENKKCTSWKAQTHPSHLCDYFSGGQMTASWNFGIEISTFFFEKNFFLGFFPPLIPPKKHKMLI